MKIMRLLKHMNPNVWIIAFRYHHQQRKKEFYELMLVLNLWYFSCIFNAGWGSNLWTSCFNKFTGHSSWGM